MFSNKERLETVIAGIACVCIGTAIAATNVSAQNKTPRTDGVACAPVETPDAMCTVPLKKGPETKICFGDHHPRCFEIKGTRLVQTSNAGVIQDSSLSAEQLEKAKASVTAFGSWLEKSLTKKPNRYNSCTNIVSIDSMSEHKVFCLSKLPATEVNAKTKDLIETLERQTPPLTSKRSSAL